MSQVECIPPVSSVISENDHDEDVCLSFTYPSGYIYTKNEFIYISSDIKSHHRHLLLHKMRNVVFIYEKLTDTYTELNINSRLDNKGPCNSDRWRYLQELHIVFQNPGPSKCTITFAKNASQCHYQILFREFLSNIHSIPNDVSLSVYWPNKDYFGHYMVVMNVEDDYYGNDLVWEELDELFVHNKTNQITNIHRQQQYVDLGFTSNVCTTRNNSISGVSMPRLKKGTLETKAIKCFQVMSRLVSNSNLPWLTSKNYRCYQDGRYPNRHALFASKIASENTVEYLRINDTYLKDVNNECESLCSPHNDGKTNSSFITMSTIVNMSKLINGGTKRRNVGSASRSSIDSYFLYESISLPFTQFFVKFLRNYGRGKRENEAQPSNDCVSVSYDEYGIQGVVFPSHLQVNVFHSAYIYPILAIRRELRMSLVETISVALAAIQFPNSAIVFIVAIKLVIVNYKKESRKESICGFKLGFMVQLLTKILWEKRGSQRIHTRYPNDGLVSYYSSFDVWQKDCNYLLRVVLALWASLPKNKSMDKGRKYYKQVMNLLRQQFTDMDETICNHMIAIMAMLGLLPKWMINHATIDKNNEHLNFFLKKLGIDYINTQKEVDKLLSTLQSSIENQIGIRMNWRDLENLLYISTLMERERSQLCSYKDFLLKNQPLFTYREGKVDIAYHDAKDTVEGGLLQKWGFQGNVFDIPRITSLMKLPKEFPCSQTCIQNMQVDTGLFERNNHIADEFYVPKLDSSDEMDYHLQTWKYAITTMVRKDLL